MRIGVLGTGMVGNAIGTALVRAGHRVMMGSRTRDNEKAVAWVAAAGAGALQGSYSDAAAFGELLFNCTAGGASHSVLVAAGRENLAGKVLVDVANPLDFSQGFPPSLAVCNTDSLGEQLQRAFPELRVVKALNTVNCNVMVNPSLLPGDHDLFICGNEPTAKEEVSRLLVEAFGWRRENLIDLGDITMARGTEMLLPIWVRLWAKLGTPNFNLHVVVGPPPAV